MHKNVCYIQNMPNDGNDQHQQTPTSLFTPAVLCAPDPRLHLNPIDAWFSRFPFSGAYNALQLLTQLAGVSVSADVIGKMPHAASFIFTFLFSVFVFFFDCTASIVSATQLGGEAYTCNICIYICYRQAAAVSIKYQMSASKCMRTFRLARRLGMRRFAVARTCIYFSSA